jgi:phosphopantetheinyl transferase
MDLHMAFCRLPKLGMEESEFQVSTEFKPNPGTLKSSQRSFQSWMGRRLVTTLLHRHYPHIDIHTSDYTWVVGKNGKPKWLNSELHFNISHCKNAVVAVIGSSPVGVDLEVIRNMDSKIVTRFVPQPYRDTCLSGTMTEMNHRFFSFWTACESLGKKTGEGVFAILNQVPFYFPNPPSFSVTDSITRVRHYQFTPDILVAVCADSNRFPECIPEWNESDLITETPTLSSINKGLI